MSDPLALERQRRNNKIMMITGIATAAIGFAAYFLADGIAGVILMMIGAAVVAITSSISNVFYKIEMKELLEKRKRTK